MGRKIDGKIDDEFSITDGLFILIIGWIFLCGIAFNIMGLAYIAPRVSYLFNSPLGFSFEEAQECSFITNDLIEHEDYFISEEKYYDKSKWKLIKSQRESAGLNYDSCKAMGLDFETYGGSIINEFGECYYKTAYCLGEIENE